MKKLSLYHWLAVGVACLAAVVPVLAGLDPKLAGVAPAVVAVLAIVRHALDASDGSGPSNPQVGS